jgi:hypothetical protein
VPGIGGEKRQWHTIRCNFAGRPVFLRKTGKIHSGGTGIEKKFFFGVLIIAAVRYRRKSAAAKSIPVKWLSL